MYSWAFIPKGGKRKTFLKCTLNIRLRKYCWRFKITLPLESISIVIISRVSPNLKQWAAVKINVDVTNDPKHFEIVPSLRCKHIRIVQMLDCYIVHLSCFWWQDDKIKRCIQLQWFLPTRGIDGAHGMSCHHRNLCKVHIVLHWCLHLLMIII